MSSQPYVEWPEKGLIEDLLVDVAVAAANLHAACLRSGCPAEGVAVLREAKRWEYRMLRGLSLLKPGIMLMPLAVLESVGVLCTALELAAYRLEGPNPTGWVTPGVKRLTDRLRKLRSPALPDGEAGGKKSRPKGGK